MRTNLLYNEHEAGSVLRICTGELGPVEVNEMGFAMSLFMGAAAGQSQKRGCSEKRSKELCLCAQVLQRLCSGDVGALKPSLYPKGASVTLDGAFAVLWHQYDGDARQLSVSARVLGFHLLAQQDGGALLKHWLRPDPESVETVILIPAVVEAVASVALCANAWMDQERFLRCVESLQGIRTDEGDSGEARPGAGQSFTL